MYRIRPREEKHPILLPWEGAGADGVQKYNRLHLNRAMSNNSRRNGCI